MTCPTTTLLLCSRTEARAQIKKNGLKDGQYLRAPKDISQKRKGSEISWELAEVDCPLRYGLWTAYTQGTKGA